MYREVRLGSGRKDCCIMQCRNHERKFNVWEPTTAEITFGRSRVCPTVGVAEPQGLEDEKDPPPPCTCLLGGEETATRSEAALILRSCEVVRRCFGEGYPGPELVVGADADGDE